MVHKKPLKALLLAAGFGTRLGELTKKRWYEKKNQLDLVNSNLFRKYRKYMIYLFKKK